ncbi:MAG: glycosyltransferase family 39 protein [Candidatus Binatia bacterium]
MPSSADGRALRVGLVLAAAYLAAALHGLGAADVVGDDEAREVGIVQEIVRGHWLLPVFNDELLPDKPILFHWLAAVPCAALGFSEAAVRLPSALAGAGIVGVTAAIGVGMLGTPAGIVAAGLVATMPSLFTHARVARPDALLVLLLTAALGLAFRWWRDQRARDATAALVVLGLAILAKGPVAPALFGLTLGAFLLWQRDLRRLPHLLTPTGLFALLLLGLGWYAVALGGWGERFVTEHLVGRYVRNLAGGLVEGRAYSAKPLRYHLLFYVQHLPAVALPWTPLVAMALWRAARERRFADPRVRFLVCWALAPVVAFTPAEWKLRYYLLPALPALALLAAPLATDLLQQTARRRGLGRARPAAVGGALLLVGGVLVALTRPDLLSESDRATVDAILPLLPGGARGLATAAGIALGVATGAVLLWSWPALLGAVAAGTIAWMALGTPLVEQATSRRASLREFAEQVGAGWPEPAPLVFLGPTMRPVVVYAGRPIQPAARLRTLAPGTAVIATEAAWERAHDAARLGPAVLAAEGRVANLERAHVVLAEVPGPAH